MTPQLNDRIYALLGTFGYQGAYNDRWRSYLKSFGLAGTNDDMLYSFLGQLGYTGTLTDRWNAYLESVGGEFVGFAKLYLDFTTGSLDSRINFTRTSNATVTRADGTIGYAPHNLLTHSEQFDNAAWTKLVSGTAGSSIISNQIVSPNGTMSADKIYPNATGVAQTAQAINGLVAASTVTASCFFKAGEIGFGYIQINGTVGGSLVASFVAINLSTGDVGTITALAGGGITSASASVTNEGNGWYRLTLSGGIGANNTSAVIALGLSNNATARDVTASGTNGIYVFGAQLEVGASPTAYNPTTVKNLLGFSESFDNAAWTKSNSFVQTNLATYSEDFSNALWVKTTTTVTTNTDIAPNGYQTADTLAATGANSTILDSFSASAVPYTFSVWLRRKTGTGNIDITVDGTTYETVAVTTTWTRFSTTLTPSAGTRTAGIRIVTSGDEIYAWGAQLVQGSVAGDYRKTDAAALPVFYPNHNGVVCAQKLVENTATNVHQVNLAGISTSVVNTFTASCYVKQAERNFARLALSDQLTGVCYAIFNLTNGTSATTTAGTWTNLVASSVNVGNGWFRISLTATKNSSSSIQAFFGAALAINNDFYAGDGTSGIYIFGAQLSDSASLDPYVLNAAAAPTAAAYYGARFDHDPVTLEPKGLLIEEQRTNLLLNSSLAGTNLATQNVTVAAVAHTLSFYGTGSITLSGTATATLTGTGAYPTRSTLTFTPTAGTLTLTVTGTVQFAQIEAGAFATSYIPTAASQVTRTADFASINGSNFYSWYNQNEGSISYEASTKKMIAPGLPVSEIIGFANINNSNAFLSAIHQDQHLRVFYTGSSIFNLNSGVLLFDNQLNKIALAIKSNDFAVSSLGRAPVTSNLATLGGDMTYFKIGTFVNGHVKKISYYPLRLSNDVLRGLTA
jgi:hypothetical protein